MRAENTNTDLFDAESGFAEDFGIEIVEKAKVGILGFVNERPSVLLLTRSILEDTRAGDHDWAGGKLDPGEAPIDGLMRETTIEELPGVVLHYITDLKTRDKTKVDGIRVIKHLFIALAEFPAGIQRSAEHSEDAWWPLDELDHSTLPDNYQAALTLSPKRRLAVAGLIHIAQQEPIWLPENVLPYQPAAPPQSAPDRLPIAA